MPTAANRRRSTRSRATSTPTPISTAQHMEKEESLLFPLAQKHLSASDWERIAAAFLENDNPLRGIRPKREVESLFIRILNLLPEAPAARAGKSRPPASR